ncbi:mannitol dehydrogenase family protein [Pelagibacterium halotolerans]|uniref:mannitol dehydrogenase family protein n=1 Tax=Pelagibacterium halotolerans TaxID=531813 RepID=UPI00384B3ADC
MPRIVHLGFGNFHRAHQAWYTAAANALGGPAWTITGVSMRRSDLRDALASDGFAYTLGIRGTEGIEVQRIAVHDSVLVVPENPQAVIDAIADPETQIVSLTVTEKGYHLHPATGEPDLKGAALAADLVNPLPSTAIGILARGLAQRAATNAPITVLSCDNVSGNGRKLRRAVEGFAAAAGLDIGAYITAHVRFPDSMVDRITPATTDAARAEIAALTGRSEPQPVLTEAFSEWIVEDDFAGPRPDWGAVGVEIVPDVAPFEARKLRLLNAAHSCLAYAGQLVGHRYVHEAIRDPHLRRVVEGLWDEAVSTLPASVAATIPAYRAALLDRFEVEAMRHELAQIAQDGSLKLPLRLVPVLEQRAARNEASPNVTQAVAAWLAFIRREVEAGRDLADPASTDLTAIVQEATDTPALCRAGVTFLDMKVPGPAWLAELVRAVDAFSRPSVTP